MNNIVKLIETKARDQAVEEVNRLIESFRNAHPRHMEPIKTHVDVKFEGMQFSKRVEVTIDIWDFWNDFRAKAIDARTAELVKEISEQVLESVDRLEFLRSEVSSIKEAT